MTADPPERMETAVPYPGLRPFEAAQARWFFGRDQQILELLERLSANRLLAVVGVSGSGKSSLVRAGLLPALEAGHLTKAGARWRFAILRPSGNPLATLAAQLNETLGADTQRLNQLEKSSFGLLRASEKGRAADENLLVLIDQFEDLFRLGCVN